MKIKSISDRLKDDAALIREMMQAMALADGFKNIEAAQSVHENIHVMYERYSNAALRAVRYNQEFPIPADDAPDGAKP